MQRHSHSRGQNGRNGQALGGAWRSQAWGGWGLGSGRGQPLPWILNCCLKSGRSVSALSLSRLLPGSPPTTTTSLHTGSRALGPTPGEGGKEGEKGARGRDCPQVQPLARPSPRLLRRTQRDQVSSRGAEPATDWASLNTACSNDCAEKGNLASSHATLAAPIPSLPALLQVCGSKLPRAMKQGESPRIGT